MMLRALFINEDFFVIFVSIPFLNIQCFIRPGHEEIMPQPILSRMYL